AVVRALKEGDDGERMWAAEILEKMGPGARAAVPDLTEALQDPDEALRKAASSALARVAPTDRQNTASQAVDGADSAGLDLAWKLGAAGLLTAAVLAVRYYFVRRPVAKKVQSGL